MFAGSPGRIVDRAALGAACAVGYYLLFLNAWGSIPLACGLAFACGLLTGWLVRRLPLPRRVGIAQARAELLRLAALPDAEAAQALCRLVQGRYPGEAFSLTPVLKHPEATLSSGDVLNAWKANREADRLVVAATCPCEPRAALFAARLRDPAVAVVDSRRLLGILRRCPADALPRAERPGLPRRLRHLAARAACAPVSPKNAAVAAMLMAAYLLTGNPWCLFPALAVLFHLGVALFQRRAGRRLFDEEPKAPPA